MSNANNIQPPLRLLLIEDNPGDIQLIKKIFDSSLLKNNIIVMTDGQQALNFLRSAEGESGNLPDIIILDLNLPKKDGREVLHEIKSNDKWKHIPVMILTSSQSQKDILASYQAHANSYVVKPMNIKDFFKIAKSIEDFWFKSCTLPSDYIWDNNIMTEGGKHG